MPSDFDVARWTMEHTDLLNKLIADLEEQGCKLFIEHQNGFRVVSSRTGAVIGGRADLIAVHPDGRAVVYDVKTGRNRHHTSFRCRSTCIFCPARSLWNGRAENLKAR